MIAMVPTAQTGTACARRIRRAASTIAASRGSQRSGPALLEASSNTQAAAPQAALRVKRLEERLAAQHTAVGMGGARRRSPCAAGRGVGRGVAAGPGGRRLAA